MVHAEINPYMDDMMVALTPRYIEDTNATSKKTIMAGSNGVNSRILQESSSTGGSRMSSAFQTSVWIPEVRSTRLHSGRRGFASPRIGVQVVGVPVGRGNCIRDHRVHRHL